MPRRYAETDFWAKVQQGSNESCWPWLGSKTRGGYGSACLSGLRTTAHRIAYMLRKGAIPEGFNILHSCDNPICCNPEHLSAGTQKDNIADMWAKGRQNNSVRYRGEDHWKVKLTDAQVEEIRSRYAFGERQIPLAAEYGVGQTHISKIVRGECRSLGA